MVYAHSPKEPIAIIGSGCRFPGNATSSNKLWSLLSEPRDLTKQVPESRFNANGFYHPDGEHHGASNVTKAYFLEEDPRLFDSTFFNIAPREAEAIDPQQRLLLETVYEAMESAGLSLALMRGSDTACYVGVMTGDYAEVVTRDPENFSQYMATGTSRALISNRVSYVFDWSGPSMTIDTACSSSLVAVHLAVQSLRSGESTVACAAGSNLILNPDSFIGETSLHMISPDGKSKMWDASANGYARGEGVAAVFLKTLSKALEDGDRIDAIIRETGVNQDGRTQGITLPSPEAQAKLIRSTYRKAGLDLANDTDRPQYFEAHGTGTQAGDPREASAISQAFFPDNSNAEEKPKELYVGSIKTVIGHTEGCAGVAGLLKVALSLKNKTIPPNQHFNNLNPSVGPSYKNLCIPTVPTPFPSAEEGQVLRASVNSFGFGGTNSHAIVESYVPEIHDVGPWGRKTLSPSPTTLDKDFTPLPLLLSANSGPALESMVEKYVQHMATDKTPLHELATTLQARRSALPFKVAISGGTREAVISDMSAALIKSRGKKGELGKRVVPSPLLDAPRILGVFTGQGAQWPTMGASLIRRSTLFRKAITALDEALRTLPDGPEWGLLEELTAPPSRSRVREAAISQPACTALQIALVDLLTASGVSFHTVVGHSSGEIAAAYAAGFISGTDAVRIAYYRGLHARLAAGPQGQKGAMMAVGWGIDQATEFCRSEPQLNGRLSVAASNSPGSVTLSGDIDAVHIAKELLDRDGVFNRALQVDTAYHSHHMIPCSGAYLESLRKCQVQVRKPSADCSWFSSVHAGRKMTWEQMASEIAGPYWKDNMAQAVLFSQAVEAAVTANGGAFALGLEVGPHPALKGPALQTIKAQLGDNIPYEGVLDRKRDDVAAFASAMGTLWMNFGTEFVDFVGYAAAFEADERRRKTVSPISNLPAYPWEHRFLWRESRINRQLMSRQEPPHELLGARTTDDSEHEPRWRNILKLEELPWLRDHRIQGQTIVPGAAYCAMALEAAVALGRRRGENVYQVELRDLEIIKAISLDDGSEGTETLFSLKTLDSNSNGLTTADFSLSAAALEDGIMRRVCTGHILIYTGDDGVHRDSMSWSEERHSQLLPMSVDRFYSALGDLGLGYTGPFRALSSLERSMDKASGVISVDDEARSVPVHPTWLDVSFQTVFAAFAATNDDSLWTAFLPTRIGCMRLFYPSADFVTHGAGLDYTTNEIAVDSYISSFEPASPGVMPKITADLDIFDSATSQHRIEIHDLTMTAFLPVTPKDDRHVYQRTEWVQDILSGASAETQHLQDPLAEEELAACEEVAYHYIDSLRSSKSASAIAEQHAILAHIVDKLPLRPSKLNDGHHHNTSQSVEIRLLRAIGTILLANGGPKSRSLRRNKEPAGPPIASLYTQWQSERLGLHHTEESILVSLKQISHRFPRMNILQIGASSPRFVRRLHTELGAQFTALEIADVSNEAIQRVEKQASGLDTRVHFSVLEKPVADTFTAGSFDLVIVFDPLVAAESILPARQLLRVGGFLVMAAPTGNTLRLALIQAGWEEANQGIATRLSPVQAHRKLQQAGFTGAISIMFDNDEPDGHAVSVVVSQATDASLDLLRHPLSSSPQSAKIFRGKILILGGGSFKTLRLAETLQSRLSMVWRGEIVIIESLDEGSADTLAGVQAILNLTELDRPVFEHLDSASYAKLQQVLRLTKTMLWVTNASASSGPYQSAMLGLARSVIAEDTDLVLQTLDLDTVEGSETIIAESLLRLLATVRLQSQNPAFSPLWTNELELAVKDGKFWIPRVVMDTVRNDNINSVRRVIEAEQSSSSAAITLVKPKNGPYVAHNNEYAGKLSAISSADSVAVRVDYCSEKPILSGHNDTSYYLCIGRTSEGNRVFALAHSNSSQVTVPKDWTVAIDGAILEEQEGNLAQLLGEAACHVQAKFLLQIIPEASNTLIYEPDDMLVAFLDNYLEEETDKSAWYVRFAPETASSACLGRHGRTITVRSGASRREIIALLPADISLVTYAGGDEDESNANFALLQGCVPQRSTVLPISKLQGILFHTNTSTEAARASAVSHIKAFVNTTSACSATDAIPVTVLRAAHLLGAGSFTTKSRNVVDWTGDQKFNIQRVPINYSTLFSAAKTYLLVGLTGQMGQSICRWMVHHGARNIIVTSRNPSQNCPWALELRALGAQILIEAADVTRRDDVVRLRDEAARDMPPVAGVINGAMLLADGLFADMSFDNMNKVLQPKVAGSRNLDAVFSGALDFFIMLSSVNAATGMIGQANYAAANMFMVGLAADRRARGLAASVIDIGMVIGIGVIQRTEGDAGTGVIEKNLRKQNLAPISERDLHHMLSEAIVAGTRDRDVEIITGLQHYVSTSSNRPLWYKNPRFSHLITEGVAALDSDGTSEDKQSKSIANAVDVEEAGQMLEAALIAYLASELKLPAEDISPDTPIIDLGIDSLVAASVRSWLLSEHQVDVPMLKVLGGSSTRQLSHEAVSKMIFTAKTGDSTSQSKPAAEVKAQEAPSAPLIKVSELKREVPVEDEAQNYISSSSLSSVMSTPAGTSKGTSLDTSTLLQALKSDDGLGPARIQELSLGQSRLYFSSLYLDDVAPFNCTTSYRLSGALDVKKLNKALQSVIARHEIFRTSFYTDESSGKAMQAVMGSSKMRLRVEDSHDEAADIEAEFQRIHHYSFDLEAGETFIATLLSHSPVSHTLIFGYHHIIIDGVSWQLFLQDLGRYYRDPSLQLPKPAQTFDFVEKQRRDIETGAYSDRLTFWKKMFPEPPSPLPLFPFAKVGARRALDRYSMRDTMVPVDATLIESIKKASVASRITPFHFWLAGYQVLLQRLLDTSDLCIGVVDANRSDSSFSETIGFLLEIMPLRFRVSNEQRFADILKETRTKTYAALSKSGVPIEEIARACGVAADKTQTPFFQVIFNYRMGATKTPDMADVNMSFLDYSDAKVPFDIAVSVDEKEDGTGFLTFSAQDYLYDQEAIDLLIETYKLLLTKLASDVTSVVGEVSLYDTPSVERAIDLGTGVETRSWVLKPELDTLSRRFSAWVAKDPNALAVKDLSGRSMTYLEASQRADAIALTLHTTRAGKGSRIAVLLEPTVDTIATILAIHRTGAVYVPLDIYANEQRLSDILDESGATILIHHRQTASRASVLAKRRRVRLLDLAAAKGLKVHPFADVSTTEDDAFILYTSGSTGKPKGIPLTHANVGTVITASTQRLSIGREVVLQQTGQGFDAAAWEIFVALANGGSIIMSDNHGDPADLAALMARERVTVTLLIISEAHSLLQYGHSSLRECDAWRVAICAGENFTPNLVDKLASLNLPGLRVFNGYGPTETSIFSALGDVPLNRSRHDHRVPVGAALPDYGMYVVDGEGQPVPVGWVGEVVICGPAVGSGYLGRPELTASKWKPADFLAAHEAGSRKGWDRLYLTGDRGRMLADGSIVILGRIDGDSQVKLRGFRVELDEVASCLVESSGGLLTDARVVVRGEAAENKFLVAFVVFKSGFDATDKSEYLRSLLQSLPLSPYMRPGAAIPLDTLPFTERGKLDAAALAKITLPSTPLESEEDEKDLTDGEVSLRNVWRNIIQAAGGVPVAIRRDSDFFSVGGNSLLLLQLKAEIRRVFDVAIPLPELFQNSTLQGLAARLDGSSDQAAKSIDWQEEAKPGQLLEVALHHNPTARTSIHKGLTVVLTGATGFLGAELLRQLVASPTIGHIHCVAVRNPKRIAIDSPKVTVHAGDLSKPLLGLPSEHTAADIFKSSHAIVHNGAEVSHMKSYHSLRAPNVGSTRELARLALQYQNETFGIAAFHFVSTAGVATLTGWDTFPEGPIPPHAFPPADGSNGYVSSKWTSERLLERLSQSVAGLRVVVHRPSNITGDDVPSQDIVHSVLRYSALLHAVPDLGADFGSFDLIGVKTAAQNIVKDVVDVAASGASTAEGDRVIYRHQSGETIVPANQLKEYLGHSEQTPFEVLQNEDWVAAARAAGLDELVAGFLGESGGHMKMPLLEKSLLN
ncbi:hypothetical protein SCAR479_11218 [Seiridium cardinale]|uniref:Uncharacterized protein n=1 Tax=Seiridium cardinale TaxID=138064 RepID=A0ABR2XEC7_9PEZI